MWRDRQWDAGYDGTHDLSTDIAFALVGTRGMGIAPATAGNASNVYGVVEAAFRRYAERMDGPPAPLLADYTRLCDRGDVTVLRHGRRIVGALVSSVIGRTLEIETLAVHPAFEGRGHGATLLEWAVDQALEKGANAVTLYTNEVMTEAQAFWLRHGFVETGRRREDGYDRVYYRRSLLPEGAPA